MIKLKRNLRLLPALHLFQFKEDSAIFPVNKNTYVTAKLDFLSIHFQPTRSPTQFKLTMIAADIPRVNMKWNTEWNKKGKHLRGYCLEVFFNWTLISHSKICIQFRKCARLSSQCKKKVRETGFYCPSNRNCRCVMRVHRYYFQGRTKNTRATCMLKPPNVARQNCLFLNKGDVFSWLWTVYSNTYVSRSYLKTTCQRQNHLRKRSSKHQSPLPASHDLRGFHPAHSWSFSREAGCFRTESAF